MSGIGTFQEVSYNHFRCNFGPGYGDMLDPIAACQHFAFERDIDVKLDFYVNNTIHRKIKVADAETIAERFVYMYDNIRQRRTTCTFLPTSDDRCNQQILRIVQPEPQWWFNDVWVKGGKKKHITLQTNELKLLRKFDPSKIHHGWRVTFEWGRVIDKLKTIGLPIVFLDYTMPIAEVHDLLLDSALHVGYSGSCTHLAFTAGVPVILIGAENQQMLDIREAAKALHGCGYEVYTVDQFENTVLDIDRIVEKCASETDARMLQYNMVR